MYDVLKKLHERPEAFSVYTADQLWTRPHLAERMLQTHLSQDTALASRPLSAIDRVVAWMDARFHLEGKAVCDLGCGPGLYAERYARRGALVQGLDFSANSIAHAEATAGDASRVRYSVADYLTDPLPGNQDLVTMIYCDLCALSPAQRRTVLGKVRASLKPGGTFVFDVASTRSFEGISEETRFGRNYMGGFWSPNDYFAFHRTHRYGDEKVSLDHFVIIEEQGAWDIYNWMQYFTPGSIKNELGENGFDVIDVMSGFGTDEADETTFGVVAISRP